jgi:hypothetical protein
MIVGSLDTSDTVKVLSTTSPWVLLLPCNSLALIKASINCTHSQSRRLWRWPSYLKHYSNDVLKLCLLLLNQTLLESEGIPKLLHSFIVRFLLLFQSVELSFQLFPKHERHRVTISFRTATRFLIPNDWSLQVIIRSRDAVLVVISYWVYLTA